MPRFAANLTMMFTELPFLERFAAAAKAGFTDVEFLFPYDFEAPQLAEALRSNALSLVLHNLPAGDWAGGERGIACLPSRVDEFRAGVGRAISYATALGCPRVNCLAGLLASGADAQEARATFVANLRFAAAKLEAAGIALLTRTGQQATCQELFNAATAAGGEAWDHFGMVRVLEKLACHEIGEAQRDATAAAA